MINYGNNPGTDHLKFPAVLAETSLKFRETNNSWKQAEITTTQNEYIKVVLLPLLRFLINVLLSNGIV